MKTILSVILTVTLLSSAVIASPAYEPKPVKKSIKASITTSEVFGRFNVHRERNGVALHFSILNADDVSVFLVERSWDGFYFNTIDEIYVSEGLNKYHDSEVYPGFLHYRIIAIMNDGSEVISPVDVVRIVSRRG